MTPLECGLVLVLGVFSVALLRGAERLEQAEARLADARMRLWTFAELVREGGDLRLARGLETLFPEIIESAPDGADGKELTRW